MTSLCDDNRNAEAICGKENAKIRWRLKADDDLRGRRLKRAAQIMNSSYQGASSGGNRHTTRSTVQSPVRHAIVQREKWLVRCDGDQRNVMTCGCPIIGQRRDHSLGTAALETIVD
jgi:hypothetical protein